MSLMHTEEPVLVQRRMLGQYPTSFLVHTWECRLTENLSGAEVEALY